MAKGIRKRTNKVKVSRRKEIIKTEINNVATKKEQKNETKNMFFENINKIEALSQIHQEK